MTQACDPATVAVKQLTTCTVTAENTGAAEITAELGTVSSVNLPMTAASGASLFTPFLAYPPKATLAGTRPAGPSSVAPDPGHVFGYIPLTAFGGNTILPLGDEQTANLDVPGFVYNGKTYGKVGISSNGYLLPGGSGGDADQARPGTLPDPAAPNNVIAPFWTDLDGTGMTGAMANVLTDGVWNWLVIEWQENVAGTGTPRVFQAWIGVNGVQDVQFAYKFDTIADSGRPLVVGAENAEGTRGVRLPEGTLPPSDLRVTSDAGQPGGKLSYTVTAKGLVRGPGQLVTVAKSPDVKPVTVTTPVTVTR
ncbi:hypothetical protein GCM10023107_88300 [Actinoplanes octamycinicus]|nr:hypothetical protein Aoc01nite_78670 [Actinoplanes octamycinicus]